MKKLLFVIAIMALAGSAMAQDAYDTVNVSMTVGAYITCTALPESDVDLGTYNAAGGRELQFTTNWEIWSNSNWSGSFVTVGCDLLTGQNGAPTGIPANYAQNPATRFNKWISLQDGVGPHTASVTLNLVTIP